MDFTCIVLFLAFYYLKPQEWADIFSTIRFVQLTMIASVITLIFRERSLKAADFFRTPHDWAMYAFFAWVVISSPSHTDTFKEFLNRLVFYVVIIHTLTNWARVQKFLGWWTAMILATAFLALAGEYFWDPLGSYDLTHGKMKGRLVLNLSMVNNPNALGHSIVPAIPMIYYFCIWKRPVFMKQIGYIALILPLIVIYLTQSKGSYIAGTIVILATLTFGRPKIVQIIIGTVFFLSASSALYLLPRMTELRKVRTDEAVQGRVQAFTNAYEYYSTLTRGIGQGNFVRRQFKDHGFYKASHSTYVQTGAELGKPGMFLFLLIMWTCFRTLMFAKTANHEQERIRRLLFVLVLSFAVSGWVVDFAYRATFFMFAAAVAAFHRHLYKLTESDPDDASDSEHPREAPASRQQILPQPALAGAGGGMPAPVLVHATAAASFPNERTPWLRHSGDPAVQERRKPKFWNRIGISDVVVVLVWMKISEMLWVYIINNMTA